MKETEFDIQVRNLLQGATEEVSPRVWEGVSAQLDRKGRVVPVWLWSSLAGVAAAAAVVAGVVFLHPTPDAAPAQQIVAEVVNAPDAAPLAVEELSSREAAAPQSQSAAQAARKAVQAPSASAQKAQAIAAVLPQGLVSVPEAKLSARRSALREIPAAQNLPSAVEDLKQLNQLAFAEQQQPSGRGLSLSAFGNLQDKRRASVPGGISRPYSAPPINATEGIHNEQPEVHFSLPISAGVGLKYNFTPRWAVGVGFRYTNLGRTFVGDYVGEGFRQLQTDIDNHQHWVGIPVHAYYDILNIGRWRVHGFGGAAAEFLASNEFVVHGSQKDIIYRQRGSRPQFSADLGLGVEMRITPHLGLYLDPSFRYYFNTSAQPRSLRTIQPLRFDVEAGLRFSFSGWYSPKTQVRFRP